MGKNKKKGSEYNESKTYGDAKVSEGTPIGSSGGGYTPTPGQPQAPPAGSGIPGPNMSMLPPEAINDNYNMSTPMGQRYAPPPEAGIQPKKQEGYNVDLSWESINQKPPSDPYREMMALATLPIGAAPGIAGKVSGKLIGESQKMLNPSLEVVDIIMEGKLFPSITNKAIVPSIDNAVVKTISQAKPVATIGEKGIDTGIRKMGANLNPENKKKMMDWVMGLWNKLSTKVVRQQVFDEKTGRMTSKIIANTPAVNVRSAAVVAAWTVGTLVTVTASVMGSKAWADHLDVDNLLGNLNMVERDARQAAIYETDPAKKQELLDISDEAGQTIRDIASPPEGFWEHFLAWFPGINVMAKATEIRREGAWAQTKIQMIRDLERMDDAGMDEESKRLKTEETILEAKKNHNDYYNSERLRVEKEILDMKAMAASSERDLEKQFYEEAARTWEEYGRQKRKEEEKDRIAIAKFWLEYKILAAQIESRNKRGTYLSDYETPSALGFGLL